MSNIVWGEPIETTGLGKPEWLPYDQVIALYRQGQHTYAAICMKWAADAIEAGDHITTGQEEGA